MPALITSGSLVVAPVALSAYASDQDGGTIVHRILGGGVDVTLRPVDLRTGSMSIDFATDSAAATARTRLSGANVWTLAHSDRTTVNMRFIVRRLSQVIDGGGRWSLTIGWEEVP